MADHMDNILKAGFTAVEGYGTQHDTAKSFGVEHAEPLKVEQISANDFETFYVNFGGADPVLVADEDPRRTKLMVQNIGTGYVFIGKRSTLTNVINPATGAVAAPNGWRITANGSLSMETSAAVYAVAPTTGTSLLCVYIERDLS